MLNKANTFLNLLNFGSDFVKPGHDQYVYGHAIGLCVTGLAPTHVAFKDAGGITTVDFNVGKSDRSGIKSDSYIVRCCVKDSLLEVNDRLIKHSKFAELSTGKGTLPLSCQSQQIGQRSKLHCWALKNTRN
uniref:Uncharacterized protein n=1 Tax=Populus alba TaxID=43335 RepID=A0A4U5Q3T2_POPAL|nr:hypothetical protein D5086_0000152240 [Populus alba]